MLGGDDKGASERRPAERSDVIAVLRGHGIAGTVAAALWTIARDLRTRTRRRGIEHAVTLDLITGQQVGSMLTGSATATNLSPHLLAIQADQEYVVLHTHPRSTSFSPDDMLVLVDHPQLSVMIAVGVDGSWYIVSRLSDTRIADPVAIVGDARRERLRLEQEGAPLDLRSHLATERVATRHGLRYDRVVGSGHDRSPV